MRNTSIGKWVFYAVTGAIVISFTPERYRLLLIALIFFGGLLYIYKSGGSIQDIEEKFSSTGGF